MFRSHSILIAITIFISFSDLHASAISFKPSSDFSMRVLTSFQQAPDSADEGLRGNCVSIAAIKAAMATFGPDGVFRSVLHANSLYTVVLRDGTIVTLTDDEDRLSESMSGFTLPYDDDEKKTVGDPDLMAKANFIWAVMTKMRAIEMNHEKPNIKDGINQLNGGDNARYIARLLGVKEIKARKGKDVSYIHANGYHAVFATGEQWDNDGWADPIGLLIEGHNGLNPIKDLEDRNFKLSDK